MQFTSKKIPLLILAVTSIVCSVTVFSFLNDPEGPNLVVVIGLAAIIYAVSTALYVVGSASRGLKRLLLVILVQILVVACIASYVNTTKPDEQSPSPVAENPEGEADPSRMTLGMTTWVWQRPDKNMKFALTFASNGTFSAKTDCNGMGGSYVADADKNISFSDISQTLMYCEGSKERELVSVLENTRSYMFTSRGELVLNLKDGTKATFR